MLAEVAWMYLKGIREHGWKAGVAYVAEKRRKKAAQKRLNVYNATILATMISEVVSHASPCRARLHYDKHPRRRMAHAIQERWLAGL